MASSRRVAIALGTALATAGLAGIVAAPPVGAATTTFTVDSLTDGVPNLTPCLTHVPGCTLRSAFAAASTVATDVEIDVPGGSGHTLNLTAAPGPLLYGGPGVTNSLTLHGNGLTVNQTTPDINVVDVFTTGTVTLDGVTITGGTQTDSSPPIGAGVFSGAGPLTISNSTVRNNIANVTTAPQAFVVGAGSFGAPITLTNVTVDSNHVTTSGGALEFGVIEANSVNVTNSQFTNNANTSLGASPAGGIIDAGPLPSTISGSTVANNTTSAQGGNEAFGILSTADTAVTGSSFTGNLVRSASDLADGVLFVNNTLLDNTVVSSNTITSGDHAFAPVFPLDLLMSGSTVANNTVSSPGGIASGGGIATTDALLAENSTITNNAASGAVANGGGIDQDPNVANLSERAQSGYWHRAARVSAAQALPDVGLAYTTIVDNRATTGANLKVSSLITFGTVVALPHVGANCLNGTVESTGYNFSDDASCQFTGPADHENAGDPDLAALANAGGPTPTRVPKAGSILIDAIPLATCTTVGVTVDQRGVTRPQGGGCDIGAVEVVPAPVRPRFTG